MDNHSISFDRAATYYDQTRGFPPGEELPVAQLLKHAGRFSDQTRLLEIGVGTGRMALPLAEHVGAIYGVDISAAMLERLHAKQGDEPIYTVQGDALRLPIQTDSVDAALVVHVFHLVSNWQAVIDELWRVLKPGGVLLSGWNEYGFDVFFEAWDRATNGANHVRMNREQYESHLVEGGWLRQAEHIHHYEHQVTPKQFVNTFRQRRWSSTWNMTDETIVRGVHAVEATVRTVFPDPNEPVTIQAGFHVHVFRVPK